MLLHERLRRDIYEDSNICYTRKGLSARIPFRGIIFDKYSILKDGLVQNFRNAILIVR